MRMSRCVGCLSAAALFVSWPAAHAGPLAPQTAGNSTVTVSYLQDGAEAVFSGDRNFAGTSPSAATNLGTDSNIKVFQSANGFGRRLGVSLQFPQVLGENETLISHNFFKRNNDLDYFPGIAADGVVTIRLEGIQFDQPVFIDHGTVLFHTLWDPEQARLLVPPYDHIHNIQTLTSPLRDQQEFQLAGELPAGNFILGNFSEYLEILGDGTSELTLLANVPYSLFMHLDDEGNVIPDGLPAPHGFLEPFHFHIEYVVYPVPEPATLLLMGLGAVLVLRRKAHI